MYSVFGCITQRAVSSSIPTAAIRLAKSATICAAELPVDETGVPRFVRLAGRAELAVIVGSRSC